MSSLEPQNHPNPWVEYQAFPLHGPLRSLRKEECFLDFGVCERWGPLPPPPTTQLWWIGFLLFQIGIWVVWILTDLGLPKTSSLTGQLSIQLRIRVLSWVLVIRVQKAQCCPVSPLCRVGCSPSVSFWPHWSQSSMKSLELMVNRKQKRHSFNKCYYPNSLSQPWSCSCQVCESGPKCKQHAMASAFAGRSEHTPYIPQHPHTHHTHTPLPPRLSHVPPQIGRSVESTTLTDVSKFSVFPKEVVRTWTTTESYVYKAWWLFIKKASTFISPGSLAYLDPSASDGRYI